MMYTMDELRVLNRSRYCLNHALLQDDLDKVNALVELLQSRRNGERPVPLDGDKVLCVSPVAGEVSDDGYLERGQSIITVCVWPTEPFVAASGAMDASGGPWENFRSLEHFLAQAQYMGKAKKFFKTWGSWGPCANGAVYFEAEVSLWKVTDERFYKRTWF